MGFKEENNTEILTNISKARINLDNPCHRAVFESNPFEYWQFEETIGTEFTGLNNRSQFEPYYSDRDYEAISDVQGLRASWSVEPGQYTGEHNFLIANLNDYITTDYVGDFSIEFWTKLRGYENNILSLGNDLFDFGEFTFQDDLLGTVSQFVTNINLRENSENEFYFEFDFNVWEDSEWEQDGSNYVLSQEPEVKTYQTRTYSLELFHHIVIDYRRSDGRLRLIINEDVLYQTNIERELKGNIRPLMIKIGESLSDDLDTNVHGYDELAFYQRALSINEYSNHYERCVTFPSISGWNPEISSKHYRFETDLAFNDIAYLRTNYDNVWNNTKGYRNNNTGAVQFDISVNYDNIDSSDSFVLGLASTSSSPYVQLASNVPCAENSIGLVYEDGEFKRIQFAIDRTYGNIDLEHVPELYDGITISILIDYEDGYVEFYHNDNKIGEFNFGQIIARPSLRPAGSVNTNNIKLQLDGIGPFQRSSDSHAAWGAISSLPDDDEDLLDGFTWDDTYQDIVLRDDPEYYWRFQENLGNNAVDEINGFRLEHQQGVTMATTGAEGFGVYYQGSPRTFSNPFIPINQWNNVSIEFWISFVGDDDSTVRIMDLRTSNNDWRVRINKDVDDFDNPIVTVRLEDTREDNEYDYILILDDFDFDDWNHIVFHFDEERLFRAYVNGELSAEVCGVRWAYRISDYFFSINASGSSNGGFYFDELAFYDYKLSQREIQEHYFVGTGIITDVQDLNLRFRGIPNYVTSTENRLYSTLCENYLRYWGYRSSKGEWNEFPAIEQEHEIRQISSSSQHILYLLDTDDQDPIRGLGDNSFGQREKPSNIPNELDMVACGDSHSLVMGQNNRVYAWGDNNWGQTNVPDNQNVVQIAAGESHNAALLSNGSVLCWGRNDLGQCNVPNGLNDVIQVACGDNFTVCLRANGLLIAWGDDDWNVVSGASEYERVVQISATGTSQHCMALLSDGTVVAWGYDRNGQIDVPEGLENVESISTGMNSSIAIDEEGNVTLWGIIERDSGEERLVSDLFENDCDNINIDDAFYDDPDPDDDDDDDDTDFDGYVWDYEISSNTFHDEENDLEFDGYQWDYENSNNKFHDDEEVLLDS